MDCIPLAQFWGLAFFMLSMVFQARMFTNTKCKYLVENSLFNYRLYILTDISISISNTIWGYFKSPIDWIQLNDTFAIEFDNLWKILDYLQGMSEDMWHSRNTNVWRDVEFYRRQGLVRHSLDKWSTGSPYGHHILLHTWRNTSTK